MTLLVLADKYFPIPYANSICLKHILIELEKTGCKILIVNRISDEKIAINKLDNIESFFYPEEKSWKRCNKILDKAIYIFHRIIEFVSYPNIQSNLVNKYLKHANDIASIDQFDAIISVCNPCESVVAGFKLKNKYPHKKWIIYNIDTITDTRLLNKKSLFSKNKNKKALNWELKMFSSADAIVTFKSHKIHYHQKVYYEYLNKMIFQDIPLFESDKYVGASLFIEGGIEILYAGRFYSGFRDPKILLDLFGDIRNLEKCKVSVYTTEFFSNYLNNSDCNNGTIKCRNYIEESLLDFYLSKADILLSIGNKGSNMFPSKIVTYISYGKPIIHIYQDDQDPVIDFLDKYPDKLLVDYRENLDFNKTKIIDFINAKHNPIGIELLKSLYVESLPAYNASQILSLLES
jgi:hypothetical protein